MATVAEIRKTLEGLPDDAVFGTLGLGGEVSTSYVREKIIVLTMSDGVNDLPVAVVLGQDKHDPCFMPTDEQAETLNEED